MTSRDLESLRWLIALTGGLYILYWVVAVARDLSTVEDENIPHKKFMKNWLGWTYMFWILPLILFCEFFAFIVFAGKLDGNIRYMSIVISVEKFLLLLSMAAMIQICIIVTIVLRTGRAIHGYLDLEYSFWKDVFSSIVDWECFIVKWQRRINESL